MCILFIAVDQHPDYPLIIAANRDEFHARLTQPSHFWKSKPHMLAGKDLQAGGTWLGVAKNGHIAALTNIRAPSKERFDAMTRGELVVNALQYKGSWAVHTQHLKNTATDYNGFNLVYGDWKNLQVFNSHTQEHHALTQGVYGLSNAQLNTPWPKTQQGVNALNALCQSKQPLVVEQLFAILSDPTQASDETLPDTGIAKPWEKMLSSIFIKSPDYGTRCSTVITVDHHHALNWEERSYDPTGQVTQTQAYSFIINS